MSEADESLAVLVALNRLTLLFTPTP
jgi:hypothetical protein